MANVLNSQPNNSRYLSVFSPERLNAPNIRSIPFIILFSSPIVITGLWLPCEFRKSRLPSVRKVQWRRRERIAVREHINIIVTRLPAARRWTAEITQRIA